MATETPTRVARLNNVHLYVSDMARSVAFYRDLLGIPLGDDPHWSEADLGGVRFALHDAPDGIGTLSSGTVNLQLEVEDADAAAEALRAQGVEVTEVMREEWGTAFEITDPDGYRIGLFQPPS